MILRFATLDNNNHVNIYFDSEEYNFNYFPDKHYLTLRDKDFSDVLGELNFNSYGYVNEVK